MFLGGGGRGTLLLGHAHDEVNHSELRTYLSQNKRMSKANTSQIQHKFHVRNKKNSHSPFVENLL